MSKSKSRQSSLIWDYFTRIDQSLAKCDVCENKFSYRTSISNLKKHIQSKHPNFKSFVEAPKYASTNKTDLSTNEPETKLSNRGVPLRVPSPTSSDASDSIAAASVSSAVEQTATSTPGPSQSKAHKPPFKKIKLTQDVPYTEGYLEESAFELKTSHIRKSPPRPNPRVSYQDEGNHICSSCPCIAAQENEYDKIGKAWASELKLMTMEQQIFAKRAIAEIIFEGQLGSLSRHSVLIHQANRTNEGDPFVENAEYVFEKSEPHTVVI